jgi:hypothetical protein
VKIKPAFKDCSLKDLIVQVSYSCFLGFGKGLGGSHWFSGGKSAEGGDRFRSCCAYCVPAIEI